MVRADRGNWGREPLKGRRPYRRVDAARRTFATLGAAAGASTEGAARSRGRVNPAMVGKTWGRGRPDGMRQEGAALGADGPGYQTKLPSKN